MRDVRGLLLVLVCVFLSACHEEVLIDPALLPSSERGALTQGRYFVAGGGTIDEVVRQEDGTATLGRVHEEAGCVFSGLTAHRQYLYGACTTFVPVPVPGGPPTLFPVGAVLVRVDLDRPEGDARRVMRAPLRGPSLFPNGMATDARGRIYIANSYSFVAGAFGQPASAALLRVDVNDEAAFTIAQSDLLSATEGFPVPNGVQIEGSTLYLSSLNRLYRGTLTRAGALQGLTVVHEADPSSAFDDFAVLPGHKILLTELTNPFPAVAQLVYPGVSFPEEPLSRLALVELRGSGSKLLHEHRFTGGVRPSSVTVVPEGDDAPPALYVTDYFRGGVHRLSLGRP